MVQKDLQPQANQPSSLWQLKPWWCQPWSILLTGTSIIAGSWVVLHRWWISASLSLAVGLWWLVFLVLVPAAYKQEINRSTS